MKAIVSVSDKAGLVDFVRGLADLGIEAYATGGTLDTLVKAGIAARSVSDLTGFPEILGGRVKTLHPAIHAGILARRDLPEQMEQLASLHLSPIDIVVVNLYPFLKTVERPGVSPEDAIENIDIGGPTLLRAAAKNYQHVLVLTDPHDYPSILKGLQAGTIEPDRRRELAAKAFQHTAAYDTHVAGYLRDEKEPFPRELTVALDKLQDLRYGENPHQKAALYAQRPNPRRESTLAGAHQLHGKALSFTNTLDLDAALAIVREYGAICAVIVKHGNPCGLACADDLAEAYRRAHSGDPVSAFGGCIGLNREVDAETAGLVAQTFYEDVIAPGYSEEALNILRKKKDLRVLSVDLEPKDEAALRINPTLALDFKRIGGGFLVQTPDNIGEDEVSYRTVSEREPTLEELTDMAFAWRAVKHVRSNAVVLAKRIALIGVGAGQMSRVDAVEIAVRKAADHSVGSVLASDAFFPKPDGIELAAGAGVTAIIQPGGSIRDEEIIRAANKHHMAMIFTGQRHFKH